MVKLNLTQKLEILCLAHKKKWDETSTLMCQFYAQKMRNSRQKFHKRLRRRMSMLFRAHSKNIRNYINYGQNCKKQRKSPKVWMKKRCNNWWKNVVNSDSYDEWIDNFRIDKNTYQFLCDKLRGELQHNENWVRKPIDVETKVGIALYKLASCSEYRIVGNQFGVHKASVYRCLKQFCAAVIKILLPEEIKMPNMEDAASICAEFKRKSGIPMILGAIDGCHIPVTPPTDGYRDYINRKTWASVVLQGIVDANYK